MKKHRIAEYRICNTWIQKCIGCMFKKIDLPLIFVFDKRTRISIHSFFVPEKINVFWLDKNKNVIMESELRPWSLNRGCIAKYLVETHKNQFSHINVGDKIEF